MNLILLLGVLVQQGASELEGSEHLLAHDRTALVRLAAPATDAAGECSSDRFTYVADFDGRLHVWAESDDLDLMLRIETSGGDVVFEDDDSGGGTTPFSRGGIARGAAVHVVVAARPPCEPSEVVLQLRAVPGDTAIEARCGALEAELATTLAGGGDPAFPTREIESLFERVSEVASTSRGPDVERLLDRVADEAAAAGHVDLALLARADLLALRERIYPPSHPTVFSARTNYAQALGAAGRVDEALTVQRSILATLERRTAPDPEQVVNARLNLAVSLLDLLSFSEARAVLELALEEYEETPASSPDMRMLLRQNLAIAQASLGDLIGARTTFEEIVDELSSRGPADEQLLWARANLATTLMRLGDPSAARTILESVLAALSARLPDDDPQVLLVRQNLASTLRATGDYAAARTIVEDLCFRYERRFSPDHPRFVGLRISLANVLLSQGETESARRVYEDLVEAVAEESNPMFLSIRAGYANLLEELGDLTAARTELERVVRLRTARVSPLSPELLNERLNLSGLLRDLGELDSALELQRDVERALVESLPEHDRQILRARTMIAGTLSLQRRFDELGPLLDAIHAGRLEQMLASAVLAPREAREALALQREGIAAWRFASLLADSETVAEQELELVETLRAASFEACRSRSDFARVPELASARERLRELDERWTSLALADSPEASDDERRSDLLEIALERDRVERDLRVRLAELGHRVRSVDTAHVARTLERDGAAVGYHLMPAFSVEGHVISYAGDRLLAKVVRPDGSLHSLELGAGRELTELLRSWRRAVGVSDRSRGQGVETLGSPDDVEELGRTLRERLLDPVLEAAGPAVGTLTVCADGLVHLVPLDALPLAGGVVGDRVRVVLRPAFVETSRSAPATVSRLVVVGAVDYDSGAEAMPTRGDVVTAPLGGTLRSATSSLEPLPGTGPEIDTVRAMFERTFEVEPSVLRGRLASKRRLLERVTEASYLHLATHGWFAGDPLGRPENAFDPHVAGFEPMTLCGVALAGFNEGRDELGRVAGILTAEEIARLDLSRCELVVLSACETNVGLDRAGQGIQSLQTALLAAGVRSAITSLWKVDDDATRTFFEHFYARLWEDGSSKADALWSTKVAMRRAGHPVRDWAGWVLSGDPE